MIGMFGGLDFERDGLLEVEVSRVAHGEVAAVRCLPLVVLLGEDCADEPEDCVVVGEHADDVGAPLDLLFDPLERVRGPDLAPVMPGEDGGAGHIVLRVREHAGGFGQ